MAPTWSFPTTAFAAWCCASGPAGIASTGNRCRRRPAPVSHALVDFTVERGLEGLETLAGIPGSVGGAVYGNAGAYGHSISERIASVRFFDGSQERTLGNPECRFLYRESVFKSRKQWVILAAELRLDPADKAALRRTAGGIVEARNRKFPPTLQCAGSIFKNLLLPDLPAGAASQVPASTVREGKVPAAWFLELVGAKGAHRGEHTRGRVPRQPHLQRRRRHRNRPPRAHRRLEGARSRAVRAGVGRRGSVRGPL